MPESHWGSISKGKSLHPLGYFSFHLAQERGKCDPESREERTLSSCHNLGKPCLLLSAREDDKVKYGKQNKASPLGRDVPPQRQLGNRIMEATPRVQM